MSLKLLIATLFCLAVCWLLLVFLHSWWRKRRLRKRKAYANEYSFYPEDALDLDAESDEEFLSLPESEVSTDIDDPITTLYRKAPQSNSGNPRLHDTNESDEDVLVREDRYATTNLRGQLAAIRQEKDLAVLRSKNEHTDATATSNIPSLEFYGDTNIPELPFKKDGSPDFDAHITNLENRITDSESDKAMLHTELKTARIYEIRYYESDTRLAENQILLLEKEDEMAELRSRYEETDKKNDELLEKNILLRSWLAELENQRTNLAQIPVLKERIVEQEKQLDEQKSITDNAKSVASQLNAKDQEIEELRIEFNKTESLNLSLRVKDDEINELRQEVQQISQLETSLCEKNLEIVQLSAEAFKAKEYASELIKKETEIESLRKDNAEKQALENQLEAKTSQIEELRGQLQALSALKIKAQQNENKIQVLNLELSKRESEHATTLQKSELQKDQYIKSSTAQSGNIEKLNERVAQLEKFETSTNALSLELDEKEREVSRLSAEILMLNNLKSELSSKDQQIDNLQKTTLHLESEIEKLTLFQSNLTAKDKDKERENENRLEQLKAQHTKQLADRDADISRLKNDLAQTKINQPDHYLVTVKEKESSNQHKHSDVDDLKLIKGIGPVIEKSLNSFGIATFKQVSELSDADIESLSAEINNLTGRIKRDNWVENALRHHAKKYDRKAQ